MGAVMNEKCSKSSMEVSQSPTVPLPSGIPQYTVEMANTCSRSNCSVSHIHLKCGMFTSATLINPKIFKRLRYNDCLVNDGNPLSSGVILSFKYASSFPYPLSVSYLRCDWFWNFDSFLHFFCYSQTENLDSPSFIVFSFF